jgi:hypothetical protein
MKKIIIVSGIQLSDNPRVVKEAATLSKAGYDVEVLCSLLKPEDGPRNHRISKAFGFRTRKVIDASQTGFVGQLDWQWQRIRRRASLLSGYITGRHSVHRLGYAAQRMLRHCLKNPADLYSIHLPQAMWVGAELIRRGATVSVDIEDWYSEDFRQVDRANAPVELLRSLEIAVLSGAAFASTTSDALGAALRDSYQCNTPVVLYNAFPLSERGKSELPPHASSRIQGSQQRLPRIGWVSQVIGPDRGLEQLVQATHHLRRPIEIHLTGRIRAGMAEVLRAMLHPLSQLTLQGQVPHEELLLLMQSYDMGFAGELAHNKSRDLTVTNKILHYFLAGIPAVCSDTQGQLEICRQVPEACRVYAQHDPVSLAAAIDSLLVTPEVLRNSKQAAWNAGSGKFCWESQESRQLEAVEKTIGRPCKAT